MISIDVAAGEEKKETGGEESERCHILVSKGKRLKSNILTQKVFEN